MTSFSFVVPDQKFWMGFQRSNHPLGATSDGISKFQPFAWATRVGISKFQPPSWATRVGISKFLPPSWATKTAKLRDLGRLSTNSGIDAKQLLHVRFFVQNKKWTGFRWTKKYRSRKPTKEQEQNHHRLTWIKIPHHNTNLQFRTILVLYWFALA